MIKGGTWTEINAEANKILIKKYAEAGIEECEIHIPGKCYRNTTLGFAHRHKRDWYKACPELLSEMSETVLACTPCHQIIEPDAKLTKQVFQKLRPRTVNKKVDPEIGGCNMPKINKPIKALKQKSKKADWMREHKCIHCHKTLSGLYCSCGQLSVKI